MLYSFYIVVFHSAKVNHAQCIAALGQSTGQERWHKEILPRTHTQEETTSGQRNDTMRHVWWTERQGAERKSNDGRGGAGRDQGSRQGSLRRWNLIWALQDVQELVRWVAGKVFHVEGAQCRGHEPGTQCSSGTWRAVPRMKLEGRHR